MLTRPGRQAWRRLRGPVSILLTSVVVVAALAVVATGTAGPVNPAVAFQQSGHWVFNRGESTAVHIDAGTRRVDARVGIPGVGGDGLFALQGDRQGFVVGRMAVTVFAKSTLTVEATLPTGQPETPIGIEVVGGPYLVYRQAGTIVRLGTPPTSIQVGGHVDRPVATDDGAVWLRRPDTGSVCVLRRDATVLDCAPLTAANAPGALAVTATLPAFLGTSDDRLSVLDDPGRRSVAAGVDLPDGALIGDRDTRGRLPVVAPGALVLADTSGLADRRDGGAPLRIALAPGDYTAPVAEDGVVAVLEQTRNLLLTFAVDGRALGSTPLPPGSGPASVVRGEDGRLYVDDADGVTTHIVGADGAVTSVGTAAATSAAAAVAAPAAVAPVPLPSRTGGTPPPGGRSGGRAPGPVPPRAPLVGTGNPPPDPVQPVAPAPVVPEVPLPGAPTGVTAVLTGNGGVKVSWRAVQGAGDAVRYRVSTGAGAGVETGATSATVTGLTSGRSYTVTVTASNERGAGPASAGVTVTPIKPSGRILDLEIVDDEASNSKRLNWNSPHDDQLGGGELVGYDVTSKSENGTVTERVTGLDYVDRRNFCSTVTYTFRVITRPPGGGAEVKGVPYNSTAEGDYTCRPIPKIVSATSSNPTNAWVTLECVGKGSGGPTSGTAVLAVDNEQRWSGACSTSGTTTVTLTDLSPGTTYRVQAGQEYGTTIRYLDTATVTTPAE